MSLNDANFMDYAKQHYQSTVCNSVKEFHKDLCRLIYLKILFGKYYNHNVLKERLILNHIIMICNDFGVECGVTIMLFKTPTKYHNLLKTFMVYLNYYIPKPTDGLIDTVQRTLENS